MVLFGLTFVIYEVWEFCFGLFARWFVVFMIWCHYFNGK